VNPLGLLLRLNGANLYCESEDIYDVVHNLVVTPLEVSYNVYVHGKYSSLGCEIVLSNSLDHTHVSPMCSQPSFSLRYYCHMPLTIL